VFQIIVLQFAKVLQVIELLLLNLMAQMALSCLQGIWLQAGIGQTGLELCL
jgi:hypothetical protein